MQEALGVILLEEISSERHWSQTFAKSLDLLATLAEEALAEHAAARTRPFPQQ